MKTARFIAIRQMNISCIVGVILAGILGFLLANIVVDRCSKNEDRAHVAPIVQEIPFK